MKTFEALEEMLITADVGFNTVMTLTEELRMEAQRRNIQDTEDLREVIVEKNRRDFTIKKMIIQKL